MSTIGFIGAGKMGLGAVLNLRKSGYETQVLVRANRQNEDELVSSGAAITKNLRNCIKGHQIVFMCLPSLAAWHDVIAAIDVHAEPGTVVVDLTSAQPDLTAETAERLNCRNIGFVDAPMLKGPAAARAGTIQLLVGGKPNHIKTVMPQLQAISEAQYLTGQPGSGHALKLINNAVTLTNSAIVYEALALAASMGIDLELAHTAMRESAAGSKRLDAIAPVLISGEHSPSFDVATALKDLELYTSLARAKGALSHAGCGAKAIYQLGVMLGLQDKPVTQLGEMLFDLNSGNIGSAGAPGTIRLKSKI